MNPKIQLKTYILIFVLFAISVESFAIIEKTINYLQKYSEKSPIPLLTTIKRTNPSDGRLGINQTILRDNLKGNLLIVDNYALIPQNNDEFPWIIRLNLATGEI